MIEGMAGARLNDGQLHDEGMAGGFLNDQPFFISSIGE